MPFLQTKRKSSPFAMSKAGHPKKFVTFLALARLISEFSCTARGPRCGRCSISISRQYRPPMDINPNDMSCKELVELVTDYLEGALAPADQRRFELHIGKCDWCKLYIDQIRMTIKAAGKLTEENINPRAREELLAVFRTWKHS